MTELIRLVPSFKKNSPDLPSLPTLLPTSETTVLNQGQVLRQELPEDQDQRVAVHTSKSTAQKQVVQNETVLLKVLIPPAPLRTPRTTKEIKEKDKHRSVLAHTLKSMKSTAHQSVSALVLDSTEHLPVCTTPLESTVNESTAVVPMSKKRAVRDGKPLSNELVAPVSLHTPITNTTNDKRIPEKLKDKTVKSSVVKSVSQKYTSKNISQKKDWKSFCTTAYTPPRSTSVLESSDISYQSQLPNSRSNSPSLEQNTDKSTSSSTQTL